MATPSPGTVRTQPTASARPAHVAVDTEKALARIRELAARAGIDAKALPPEIDATAEEVEDDE